MNRDESKKINDDKILIAKMRDKEKICRVKNKISNTSFLDMYQKSILIKEVKDNFIVYGGYDGADREIILFYPDKLKYEIAFKYFDSLLSIIRISLPNDLKGEYEHRVYLSGMMKLGIEREKFGDIIVSENGADIIVFSEIAEYIKNSLKDLKRFSKCNIEILELKDISTRIDEYDEFNIIIPSLRVDSVVSEVGRMSRNHASDVINEGRVFINSELVYKDSKIVKIGDILTIRGKGKFIIDGIVRETEKRKVSY